MDHSLFPTPELSVSLASVAFAGSSRDRLTEGVAWVSSLGVRFVQLDAMSAGVRPRELDRSARREVAAMIRRASLAFSGVDLWIPPEHFLEDSRADRAVNATIESIRFAGEIASLAPGESAGRASTPIVSLVLPADDAAMSLRNLFADEASEAGVLVADHAWPPIEAGAWSHDHLGVGIDPATIQLAGSVESGGAGVSAGRALAQNADRLASARLSDTDGTSRVPAGEGRLSVFEYVASAVTGSLRTPLVIDLRDLDGARAAAPRIIDAIKSGTTGV